MPCKFNINYVTIKGISGNAYGFLKLYKAKKDIKYLQYAYKFLTFKND